MDGTQFDFDADDLMDSIVSCGVDSEQFDFSRSYVLRGYRYASNGFVAFRMVARTNENTFEDAELPPIHESDWDAVGADLEVGLIPPLPTPEDDDGRFLSDREPERAPTNLGDVWVNSDVLEVFSGAGGIFRLGPVVSFLAGDQKLQRATIRVVGKRWDAIIAPCGQSEQGPVYSFRRLLRLRERFRRA